VKTKLSRGYLLDRERGGEEGEPSVRMPEKEKRKERARRPMGKKKGKFTTAIIKEKKKTIQKGKNETKGLKDHQQPSYPYVYG